MTTGNGKTPEDSQNAIPPLDLTEIESLGTAEVSQNAADGAGSPNGPEPGSLVAQPGGRGAIRHGSKRGTNRAGAGEPARFFREMCREGLYKAHTVETLVGIISGDIGEEFYRDGIPVFGKTKNSDRIKAAAFLAGYAYGQPIQMVRVEDTSPNAELTPEVILARLAEMARNLKELGSKETQAALNQALLPGATDGER